jgi:hypothetical protein
MLFPEKKCALVRLSDAIKTGLEFCAQITSECVTIYTRYEKPFAEARSAAQAAERREIGDQEAEARIRDVLAAIPGEDVLRGCSFQKQLHGQALATILTCCFTLESYVNSFAYFLFQETDFLGLVKQGRQVTANVLMETIEQMRIRTKWDTLAKMGHGEGFDHGRAPFQDFDILFKFRDDHVHDKVVPLSEDRSATRYNGNLPDPVWGMLDLGHALYAGRVYWDMVKEIHAHVGVKQETFRRHYNLAPWASEGRREYFERLAVDYERKGLRPGRLA